MKIVLVVRPAEGGILQHLQQLLAGIPDFEFVLVGPSALQSWAQTRRFIPLEVADGLKIGQDYAVIRRLRLILKEERPQIVHAHGLKAALVTGLASRFPRRGRFLFTAHNMLPQPGSMFGRLGHRFVKRWIFTGMDRIISVSDAVRSQLIKYAPAGKVLTIRNGITLPKFSGHSRKKARQLQGLAPDAWAVGTVARLIPGKGLTALLEAVSLAAKVLPNLQLIVVGDGPKKDKLVQYSRGLGLEGHVSFLGWRDDVPQLMAGWECFALPSLSEGFNLSVLEAMASRLPVVVSDLPSFREAVVPNRGGFLTAPGQVPELAAALLHLYKEPEKAARMGEFNFQRVSVLFGEKEMVECTRALYEGLVGR
ncbi:MAG TPA: glycosyltransferase family 4 protein [Firmicutes bacterium]|nr:glycosyltransferase family 4 protein [Bacillota bacterium]